VIRDESKSCSFPLNFPSSIRDPSYPIPEVPFFYFLETVFETGWTRSAINQDQSKYYRGKRQWRDIVFKIFSSEICVFRKIVIRVCGSIHRWRILLSFHEKTVPLGFCFDLHFLTQSVKPILVRVQRSPALYFTIENKLILRPQIQRLSFPSLNKYLK